MKFLHIMMYVIQAGLIKTNVIEKWLLNWIRFLMVSCQKWVCWLEKLSTPNKNMDWVFKKKSSKNWSEQLADELHKSIIRKLKKGKVIVSKIDDIWSADLVDMQQLKSYNHGFRYTLSVIDGFSKFVWSVPIKDKTGITIANTFQSIVKTSKRKPKKLWVDNRSEFYSNIFQK